tara:strand:- start:30 stop:566 length:537 start_codon:yes stop_codon:yes gene_type:complete
MTSLIKVDAIQKLNGSVPKASDLGLNVTGTVLQVVTAVDTDDRSTTSQSFVVGSNTAQVNITPSSTSSKILVHCSGTCNATDGDDGWYTTIFRDSTNLGNATTGLASGNSVPAVANTTFPFNMMVLDSPSTTSQITYGLRFCGKNADSDVHATTVIGREITGTSNPIPTHIVAMEIAG